MCTRNWIGFLAILSQVVTVVFATLAHDNVMEALIVLNEEMAKLDWELYPGASMTPPPEPTTTETPPAKDDNDVVVIKPPITDGSSIVQLPYNDGGVQDVENVVVVQSPPKPKTLFGAEDMFLHILHAMPEDTSVNVHVYVDEDVVDTNKPKIDCSGEVANVVQKREVAETVTAMTPPSQVQVGTLEDHSKHEHYDRAKKAKRQIGPGIDPYAWDPLLRWSRSRLPQRPPPPMGRQQQPSGPPPQESMKRVIFVRCPYYPCPRGFVCDSYTNSCRPLFFPDYDF